MKKILLILSILISLNIALNAQTVEEAYPNVMKECNNGNMEKCGTLSQLSYVNGYTHKKNLQKTFNYGKVACNGNDGKGCFYLGLSYLDKHDGILAVDTFKAFEYYTKSCNLGHASGCFSVARSYEKGDGVKVDYKKAVKFYEKAIKMGNKGSYINLGLMTYNGNGVKRNAAKAKKFFGIACDAKIQMGCDLYADVINK